MTGNKSRSLSLWLTIPPVFSIPIVLLLYLFGSGASAYTLAPALWGSILITYLILTLCYGFLLAKGLRDKLISLQMIAQGLILTFFSIDADSSSMLSWLGIALTSMGIIFLFHHILTGSDASGRSNRHVDEAMALLQDRKDPFNSFPLPGIKSDDGERITKANKAFLSLVNTSEEEVLEKPLTEYLPSGVEMVEFGNRKWRVERREDGKKLYVYLLEIPEGQKNISGSSNRAIVDEETETLNRAYADIRIPSEIERAARYRRWLSGIMIRIVFNYHGKAQTNEDLEKAFLTEYAVFLRQHIRSSDLLFRFEKNCFVILLPETPQNGVKKAKLKLKDIPESLRERFSSWEIQSGSIFYNGNQQMDYEAFIRELSAATKSDDA